MRQPKPYFRKQTASYYVQLDGRQISLGKDEPAAWEKYHALMANRQEIQPETKVQDLLAKFLAWVETHREPATYDWYCKFVESFADFLSAKYSAKLALANLKPFHATEWLDSLQRSGDNTKNGAVRAIMRCFNWAAKQGHIPANPIKGVERPTALPREAYISPEQAEQVFSRIKADDPFREFVTFLRETGCRPQEARHAEARHFDRINKQLAFPVKESKGKKYPRAIPLNDCAFAMISRLALKYPEGKLFRNRAGRAWTAFSLNCRCARLTKKLGFDVFPYIFRHAFITDALLRGCDVVTLAIIVGHRDATMILKTYQHLKLNTGHVRAALALATGEVPARRIETA